MDLDFKQIKNIDHRSKMIVYGFNKEARKSFPQDLPYYNIPPIINHVCLLFYWQQDFFAIFNAKQVKLSDDKMEAITNGVVKDGGWNTVYGNMIFDNQIHSNAIIEYTIMTNGNANFGAFGIVSAGEEEEKPNSLIWQQSSSKHKHVYSLHLSPNSKMYRVGNATVKETNFYTDYSDGDENKVTIDIPSKSITFYSITKQREIGSYLDIDFSIKYRFAVSLWSNNSVKIISVKFL